MLQLQQNLLEPPKINPEKEVESPKQQMWPVNIKSNPHLHVRNPEEMFQFSKEHKREIHEYFFKRIQKAIHNDWSEAYLFDIAGPGYELIVLQDEYPEALQQLQKYFIKSEQYERIAECKRLLDKHQVNLLLRQAK